MQFATVTLIFILRPWKWILCGASVLVLAVVAAGLWISQSGGIQSLKSRLAAGRARRSGILEEETKKSGAAPKAV